MTHMTPANEALAFRIWQFAQARGWSVSRKEIADHTVATPGQVDHILREKKWGGRIARAIREDGSLHEDHRNRGAYSQRLRGNDFDENLLDLTQIIGD